MTRRAAGAAVLLVAVLAGGCGRSAEVELADVGEETETEPGSTAVPGTVGSRAEVAIVDDATTVGAFVPDAKDVPVGTEVAWLNSSQVSHLVDFADAAVPDSAELVAGASHVHLFTSAGSFAYVCRLHPQMTGTLTVVG